MFLCCYYNLNNDYFLTMSATGETYCRTESVSDIGAPLGLGVVFVLAGITICVLVFILYKGR